MAGPWLALMALGPRILADLSRRDAVKDGWVDIAHVVSMAGHKACDLDRFGAMPRMEESGKTSRTLDKDID